MRTRKRVLLLRALSSGLFLAASLNATAGSHTWDVVEAFSNADGSIWFIEMLEAQGTPGETGVGGHSFTSNTKSFEICILSDGGDCNVTAPTSGKRILFGNPGYAELAAAQGAPPADQVVNISPFFSVAGDTLTYSPWDTMTFGPVPVDGVQSMNDPGGAAANTPTNYVGGVPGSINANSLPPSVVPETMTVEKLAPDGSSLRIFWDTSACALDRDHQIVFGQRSGLPASPGGTYLPSGGVCAIGPASPFTWNSTPVATDGSGLIWWVIVVNNDSNVEGSWGTDGVGERSGPGLNGSSVQCGVTNKSLANTCGS